jgi:hypothetical protein
MDESIAGNIHRYIKAINTANVCLAYAVQVKMLHVGTVKSIPAATRKPHTVHLILASDLACYKRIKAIERY